MGFVLGQPTYVSAQSYCDQIFDQLDDSYYGEIEVTLTGTMEDIELEGSLYSFFLNYGCDEAYVEFKGRPDCGEGARVKVDGVVIEIDIFDVVEANRVTCLGH